MSDRKYQAFNPMDGQANFFGPFPICESAYAAALRMIRFRHAGDMLIPSVKLLVKALAGKRGMSRQMNEFLVRRAGEEEETATTHSLDWSKP